MYSSDGQVQPLMDRYSIYSSDALMDRYSIYSSDGQVQPTVYGSDGQVQHL